jgi:hypothetical protein
MMPLHFSSVDLINNDADLAIRVGPLHRVEIFNTLDNLGATGHTTTRSVSSVYTCTEYVQYIQ